jgi:hypothetical protein
VIGVQGQSVRPLRFDWNLKFTRPATRLAHEYWESCRAGRTMPTRADLKPAAMHKFTEHVGLVEVRAEPGPDVDYFIRRAGTKWEQVFGPMTGRLIHDFLPPEIETRWREVFDPVRTRVVPVRVTTGITFQRKTWLETEMFVGPLGADRVSMLFLTFVSWSALTDS